MGNTPTAGENRSRSLPKIPASAYTKGKDSNHPIESSAFDNIDPSYRKKLLDSRLTQKYKNSNYRTVDKMPDYHSKKDIEKSLDFASRFLLLSKKVSDSNWGAVFCDRNILVYGEQMPQSEIKKGNMSDLSFSDYPISNINTPSKSKNGKIPSKELQLSDFLQTTGIKAPKKQEGEIVGLKQLLDKTQSNKIPIRPQYNLHTTPSNQESKYSSGEATNKVNIKGLTDYGALKDRIQSNRSEKQSIASPTDLKVLEIRNDLFGSDFRKNQEGSKMTSEFVTPSRDISKTMSRLKIEKPEPEVKDEHRYTIVGNGSSGNHRNSNWEAMNRPTQRNSNENRDHISHLGQFKYSSGKQEQRVPREMNNYSSLSQSQNINSRTIFTEREKQQKFKILSRYISRDFLDPIEGTDLGNRQEFTPNSQASDNLVDEDGFYSGPVERTAEKKRGNFESRIKNVQMDQRFDRLANFDKRYESTDQKEEDNFYYSSRQIHSRQQSPIRSEEEQNVVKDKFYKKANAEPGRKRLEVPMVEEAELGTASGISGMKDSYLNRVLEKVTRDKSPVHIDRNALLSHRISPLSRKMGRENQPQPQKNNYTPREIARMSAQPNLAFPSFGMDQQFSNKNFNQTSAELNSMNSISTASSKIRIKLDLGSLAQRNLSETGF